MTLKNWNLGTCHPHVKVNTNARIFKFSRKFYIRMIWLGIGTCPCNNILLEVLDTWKNALEAIIYKDFSTIKSGFLVLTLFKYSYIQKYIFNCYYLFLICAVSQDVNLSISSQQFVIYKCLLTSVLFPQIKAQTPKLGMVEMKTKLKFLWKLLPCRKIYNFTLINIIEVNCPNCLKFIFL